jgi:hypothetical protein
MSGAVPHFWMNEASGVLRPAVEAYLHGERMTPEQIGAMRGYLRQWIEADVWRGPLVDVLRTKVDDIITQGDISAWLDLADDAGIDPL